MPRPGRLPEVLRVLVAAVDRTVAWQLALALVLVVAGGILSGLAPLALKSLVDEVAAGVTAQHWAAHGAVLASGALYLLALGAGRVLTEVRPMFAGAAEQRLHSRLRQRFFAHLLRLRPVLHLGRRTGALVHSLQQATTGYQLIFGHMLHSVVPVMVELATVVVVLAHLDQPALMATFAATAAAYVAVFAFGAGLLTRRARDVTEASLNTHAILADSLLNHETIKCFNAEPAARQRLWTASRELEHRWLALYRRRAGIGLALTLAFIASTATSLALAADAVAGGSLTIGGFVMANVYMLQLVRPLETLGAAVRDLSQALAFIGPLLDVLLEPAEAPPTGRSAPAAVSVGDGTRWTSPPCIRFEGVHFAYDTGPPVLNGLDLEVGAFRSVAIVGASGAGKSSLVRLLLRLCEPTAGRILLNQVPIDTISVDTLRAMIGLVPQDVVLFNDTIAANIGIGKAGAARHDIERAARIAQVHDFVASLPAGYDTPVGERGLKLSGGERQRIAIARVVLKQPSIYVFDEATSMLDVRTEAALLRSLREHTAGCTTITIAHRLSTARQADEIVVLEDGRMAERGGHASLLASHGPYARLWRAQLRDGQT